MTLTGQNDGVNFVVFPQLPDEQLGEVVRVDELPERRKKREKEKSRIKIHLSSLALDTIELHRPNSLPKRKMSANELVVFRGLREGVVREGAANDDRRKRAVAMREGGED